ncbi:MAG: IclR family transcriptional regulator [Pseudomonadota bacterium]
MRPVQTALAVIETIGRRQPTGVSEIARELELPKSTVQRTLKALEQAGWIEAIAAERGAWSLSLQAGLAVGRADFATRRLRTAAMPVMEDLRRRTSESIYLAIRHQRKIALVERLDGLNPAVHAWPLWQAGPMHATSLGKAILAMMGEADLDDYMTQPLRRVTPRTETDPARLREELAVARARGFAVTFQTNWPGENGVGAGIRDERGGPFAAISISAPVERVDEVRCLQLGELLMDAARRISLGMARR